MTATAATAVQPGRGALAVFSFSLFLSAACMFSIQPMAGKMLLPLVGGTPAGWVVAMAFFQVMLLAGYFLAHLLSRLDVRAHGWAYLALLAVGAPFLPLDMAGHVSFIHAAPRAADVFLLLSATLAVPFIALSAASTTLQRLFTITGHKDAKDPYFLYAASNLGSFTGLLAYPFLIEPFTTLAEQARDWQVGYIALNACVLACLTIVMAARGKTAEQKRPASIVSLRDKGQWLILSFLPSSLLMGLTTYLTTDIISVPLVWVVPLAIYLLGFVVAFSRRQFLPEKTLGVLAGVCVVVALMRMAFGVLSIWSGVLQVACFAVFILFCDTRLAARRPPEDRLSEYYLTLALGGALGGLFNAFIVPHIFVRTIEYPLAVMAVALLLPRCRPGTLPGNTLIGLMAVIALFANTMPGVVPGTVIDGMLIPAIFAGGIGCIFFTKGGIGYIFPLAATVYAIMTYLSPIQSLVYLDRNFFGALKVFDAPYGAEGKKNRYFMHGTTLHGVQMLSGGPSRSVRTTYYTAISPLTQLFRTLQPKNVAVLGLGAGTINCYMSPDRHFTYIEIDPDVVEIARKYITFLDECKNAAPARVIVGDGRLEMARMEKEKFDLVVMDAFSSDSIPTHLLTREALETYMSRLTPDGVIVINITNRHFELHKPIESTAAAAGLATKVSTNEWGNRPPREEYAADSAWVVVGRAQNLAALTEEDGWRDIPEDPGQKPWTDNYTNLLRAMRL